MGLNPTIPTQCNTYRVIPQTPTSHLAKLLHHSLLQLNLLKVFKGFTLLQEFKTQEAYNCVTI